MNPTIQSGMHPDAESLTAFAEQLLPAPERDQILVHMATCSRCREVVFLAQNAIEEEQPAAVPVAAAGPAEPRVPWFRSWRWAWIPVAALAGFVGFAVVQHFRQPAAGTQLSAKLPPTDNLKREEPAKALPVSPPPAAQSGAALEPAKKAKASEVRDDALSGKEKDAEKQLDEKKSVERREFALGTAASSIVIPQGLSERSAHGMVAARAKSAAVGGPMAANEFQQQQNMATRQNALQSQDAAQFKAANNPVNAGPVPATASQTVTVQSEAEVAPRNPAPAPSVQLSTIPLTDKSYSFSAGNVEGLNKAQKVSLPSGLGTLSVVTAARRTIALDTANALFLSEDGGKHWQPIQIQWTGHAVLLRSRPVAAVSNALELAPSPRFELVNDNLQTWLSSDGKTWIPQPLPVK